MDDGGDGGKGGVEAQEGFTVRGAPPPPLAASLLTDNASPGGSPFRDQRNASTPGQTSLQSERPQSGAVAASPSTLHGLDGFRDTAMAARTVVAASVG